MPATVFSRSRTLRLVFSLAICLVSCGGPALLGQIQPPPSSPAQSKAPATSYDPSQPQVQPSLNVDRDPVLSPDPEDNAPVGIISSTGTGKAGEIQKGQGGIYTLHEDVNEVVLNCTAFNEKGQAVPDLTRSEMRVWEDDVPQTIDSFQHQDTPVSMAILVDNSGSMLDKRAAVETAALDLVRASNRKDAALVVNFSDKVYLDQELTSDIAALERGLSHFDSKNTTALYDAVAVSADELNKHAKQPKKVLLIITDGADNASRLTLEQAIRHVQNLGGPAVYSIGLLFDDDKEESQRARNALETLSHETGGFAYFPASLQDVDEIAGEVARVIRDQYKIGYHSTKPANLGGYRTVRVEAYAANHHKIIITTRKGYYPRSAASHTPALQPMHVVQ